MCNMWKTKRLQTAISSHIYLNVSNNMQLTQFIMQKLINIFMLNFKYSKMYLKYEIYSNFLIIDTIDHEKARHFFRKVGQPNQDRSWSRHFQHPHSKKCKYRWLLKICWTVYAGPSTISHSTTYSHCQHQNEYRKCMYMLYI